MAGEEINREEAILLILLISAFLCPDLKKTCWAEWAQRADSKTLFLESKIRQVF